MYTGQVCFDLRVYVDLDSFKSGMIYSNLNPTWVICSGFEPNKKKKVKSIPDPWLRQDQIWGWYRPGKKPQLLKSCYNQITIFIMKLSNGGLCVQEMITCLVSYAFAKLTSTLVLPSSVTVKDLWVSQWGKKDASTNACQELRSFHC